MFSKETYVSRRERLKTMIGNGVVILFGNNESPMNYPANTYYPMRQDSSFLYFFGLHRDGLAGVIDIDNDEEYLLGDDIGIDDIMWYGSVDSVADMALQAGVAKSAPANRLANICKQASAKGRKVHFLPPYRHDIEITIMDLLAIHPSQQREAASLPLIKAVVEMRSAKEPQEIEAIERACDVGYLMHTTAMSIVRPGVTEKFVGGQVDRIANSYSAKTSFPTIFSQHGEIMHGNPSMTKLQEGRLALCDAGCELDDYCSDNTRTMPVSGRFSQRQRELYSIVEECHDLVPTIAKPGVKWYDVHMAVCRLMTERLKEIGLMRGDTDEAVTAGAHAMFMPHGLGHMMGMDVHDMEGLGQVFVGFDDEVRPSDQFGTNCLRLGRRLRENFVMTDEPGIYFIPALIDDWQKSGHCAEYLNFDMLNTYRDFGGIRIEDDLLITAHGCRFLGKKRIPYHPNDVEEFMAANKKQ